jgi:hypothetical protein
MTEQTQHAIEQYRLQKLDEISKATWLPRYEKTRFRKMIEWEYRRLLKYFTEHSDLPVPRKYPEYDCTH